MATLRLNLGCGVDVRAGFLNIDAYSPGADVRMDVRRLALGSRAAGHAEALHLVEHLGYVGTVLALAEWYRVLAPGATLVVETPDLYKAARLFTTSSRKGRGLLASWIYGIETPGMEHRFCFELHQLRSLLRQAGFTAVEPVPHVAPSTHPGIRVKAIRGSDPLHEARAVFLYRLVASSALGQDHAVDVEFLSEQWPRLARALGAARATGAPAERARLLSSALVDLAAYDPRAARSALDAAGDLAPPDLRERWSDVLGDAQVSRLQASLTALLLGRPVRPGLMARSFLSARDRGRAFVRWRAGLRARPVPLPEPCAPGLEVVPFSRAALARASSRWLASGLRLLAAGQFQAAEQSLVLAASTNGDDPIPVWNLARAAIGLGRRARARARLEQAALCAWLAGQSDLAEAALAEGRLLAQGGAVSAEPVSPSFTEREWGDD